MSFYSARTGLSSILKNYSPAERDKVKNAVINKVRFSLPREQGVVGAIDAVLLHNNWLLYSEFIAFMKESSLTDADFHRILTEARQSINKLTPIFSSLVEALISLDWQDRPGPIVFDFVEFYVDLLVAHTKYVHFGISHLISHWIPKDKDAENWVNGTPSEHVRKSLFVVHQLLRRLLTIIPMSFDVVLEAVEKLFPYYKKPAHVVGGYVHSCLWMLEYKPIFGEHIIQLLFRKLLVLDANASRADIEDAEYEEEDVDSDAIFQIEVDDEKVEKTKMNHPIAETLDICMEKMFQFVENVAMSRSSNNSNKSNAVQTNPFDTIQFFESLLTAFDDLILPSHNPQHVQFLLFYICSFKQFLVEKFLSSLWNKVTDPNISAMIRQTAVGYIASFLARSKYSSINSLRNYLAEMCAWARQYIERSDSVRMNNSLKANIVFFAVCQSIFYMISFRSRDLTNDKKGLLFLQSLQLSAIVGCGFNPLRVCLPAVATAFAGVTRAYQLAYCHTILERNARRKLATVYANETTMPEECLETFFPFDPYLLKKSGKRITPLYLQYQASEAEEDTPQSEQTLRRKRTDSMSKMTDDVDDFLFDKRVKSSHDKEMQFTYGLSPGYHI